MTNEIKLPEPDAWQSIRVGYTADTVRQLITEAVAAEREACANLCDNARQEYQFPDVAFLIRARG